MVEREVFYAWSTRCPDGTLARTFQTPKRVALYRSRDAANWAGEPVRVRVTVETLDTEGEAAK